MTDAERIFLTALAMTVHESTNLHDGSKWRFLDRLTQHLQSGMAHVSAPPETVSHVTELHSGLLDWIAAVEKITKKTDP